MADTKCWFELAQIYMSNMNYSKAMFCFEEILVLKPSNYIYNLKYAEMLYSMGGGDNLVLARKYFSKAVSLSTSVGYSENDCKSVRALWGLLETCKRLESLSRKYQDEVNEELIEMCKEKLADMYQGKSKLDIGAMS
uniref:ER membrane protein complex subunit 2 n=1 Tax=Euplotes harpa TaxID=151035 RepID=A0A7S3JF30_9SPIT|mmetsp:Transcript_3395/g.4178  ORF Transcript_3395/g.4178 Transcript_3395/m.4178 type:complete len:137 (+) Transcript_3395:391-801(+)